jgi:hypothetical protein
MPMMPPMGAGAGAGGRDGAGGRSDASGLLAGSSAPWAADPGTGEPVAGEPVAGAAAGTGLSGRDLATAALAAGALAAASQARRDREARDLPHTGPHATEQDAWVDAGPEPATAPATCGDTGASAWDDPAGAGLLSAFLGGPAAARSAVPAETPVDPAPPVEPADTGFTTWRPLRPVEGRVGPPVEQQVFRSSFEEPDPAPAEEPATAEATAEEEQPRERSASDLLRRASEPWGGAARTVPGVVE